jgi:eukaryotic-like serine/threonine-protein kinase
MLMALVLIGATVITTLQMFEARRQRDAALYESRRAEFQSRFAFQIMSQVGADGRPMTMKELMDKGIEVLEKNYGDDPRFIIGMLVQISGRYMDLRDTKGEHAALVKAEGIARKLGDPERIAFVQCNTVETELALGRPEAARERMRDGLENLAKMGTPSFDRRTDCGTAQARLLWAEGRLPEAIEAGTRVAAMFEAENKTTDISYQTIATMLEVMLGEQGRRHEALEWNERSAAALERMGAQGTLQMVSRHHNRANHLAHLGELREALNIERGVVGSIEHQQKDDVVKSPFLNRLGFYMARVEESAEGIPLIDRALATAVSNDNHMDQIGGLMNRAQANVHLGRLDPVLPDIEAAEQLARANPDENREWMRQMRFIRAQVMFARSEPGPALEELDRVLAEIDYPTRRVANRLAAMVTLKSRAELALGRNAAALASAQDALRIAEVASLKPERSADVGGALMALASAQRAAGDASGARASAGRAVTALTNGLGPNHSETRAARDFQ